MRRTELFVARKKEQIALNNAEIFPSLPGARVYCTEPDVTHLTMSTRTVPVVPVIPVLTLTHRIMGDVTLVLSCRPTKFKKVKPGQ